ncbi:hypothetical protein M426DRAFT_140321 [Hypoxylon sp. CI-4A]|nr:hypothetical protein M426DRAFT_140321 [Hypoxylon sp. CI-4A]
MSQSEKPKVLAIDIYPKKLSPSSIPVKKLYFQPLFTYNTHVDREKSTIENQENQDDASTEVTEISRVTLSTIQGNPGISIPQNIPDFDYAFSARDDSIHDEDVDSNDEVAQAQNTPLRIIITPGRIPFAKMPRYPLNKFVVPTTYTVASPALDFQDLCRVAEAWKMLDDIVTASIVTDVVTMSALFYIVDRAAKGITNRGKETGFFFALHKVENAIFLKLLNDNQLQGTIHTAAINHMMEKGLTHHWETGGNESQPLNVHKRAIKYLFGAHQIVIEDDAQVTTTNVQSQSLHQAQLGMRDSECLGSSGTQMVGPQDMPYAMFRDEEAENFGVGACKRVRLCADNGKCDNILKA